MKKPLLALAVVFAVSPAFSQTAFNGTYTWGANGNTNSFAYNGTDIANLTESAFTKVGVTTSSNNNNFRASSWALDPSVTNMTGSLDPSKYFQFSLTADTGFNLNMTNVNFGVGRSATGPRNFAWSSSLDGFAAIITNYIVPTGVTNSAGTLTVGDVNAGFTNIVLDLSGASFQNLTTITFRFYGWNAEGTAGTGGIQGPLSFSGSLLNTNPVTGGNYWAVLTAGGGSGTWTAGGTTWATNTGGAGAGQTQSTSTLNFADTAGTVTVSGGVSVSNGMTFQTTGYTVQGSTVTLAGAAIANNALTTGADVTTTISSELAGTTGMTKSGTGTLILSGANTFSGNAAISAGTLQITNDSAIGDAGNDLANNGTLKTTTSVSLGAGRDLSGGGTYDIANGATLTVNGSISNTATTLANTGTLDLQGATRSLGNITLNAPMTLNAAGAINATGLTAPGVTNGTATINPDIVFTTGTKTLNVGSGGSLTLNGAISGATTIAKTGAGSLTISASNSAQIRIGSSAASPTDGGTVILGSASSAGSGQIQLNYGTLSPSSAMVVTNGLSIGGRTNGAALLAGGNMEFQGQSAFFRGTGTTGELLLNVDNTTTFSGGFAVTSGGGTATGVTFGGSGRVIISGDSANLTDAITLADTVKLIANSGLGSTNVIVGSGNAIGGTGTISGALSLASGAKFIVFDLNDSLAVSGNVSLDNTFSINSLLGANGSAIDWSLVGDGIYTLISSTNSFSNIQNFGEGNKASIGGDRFAYFSNGSLQLNVVPEPSTYALLTLSALGLAGFIIRCRRP